MPFSDIDITKAYIILGKACNLKCRYCLEDTAAEPAAKRPSPEVIRYIQHLADLRPRNSSSLPSRISVTLFGGEPLLYFEAAKEIVTKVNRDNINWLIETNGTLLTDEIADFCNEHRIKVVISNDGPQTVMTRGRNVFDDEKIVQSFRRVKNRGIECVITKYSQDIYGQIAYWEKLFGPTKATFAFLIPTKDLPEDLFNFDLCEWKKTCARFLEDAARDFIEGNESNVRRFLSYYIEHFHQHREGRATYPRCNAYINMVNLDLDGNTYLCHGLHGCFGHISTGMPKLSNKAAVLFRDLYRDNRQKCFRCKWLPFCKAHCPFALLGPLNEKQCALMSIFFEAIEETMRKVDSYFTTEIEL